MPGLTLRQWGPAAWNTLHAFAHTAPEQLDERQADDWRQFLQLFSDRLPCPHCRSHFDDFLRRRVDSASLSTRDELVRLLNDAHNEVNARHGKRVYTLEEHRRIYRRPRPLSIDARFVTLPLAAVLVAIILVARSRRSRKNVAD